MAVVPAHLGVLQIEPTDHCNLACRMCAPHAEAWPTVHGVAKGWMDPALHRRILAGLVEEDCRFDHVIYQWLGDPSAHREVESLVADATRALAGRVDHVRMDTNGVLFGPDRVERLLGARHPDTRLLLVYTLDAVTPDTYRRVKGRDHLDRAVRHARALLAARARHPGRTDVQLQFVVQPGNAHEAGEFLRYWRAAAACHGRGAGHTEVMFKRLSVGGGARGQADADRLYDATVARFAIRREATEAWSVSVWDDRPWQHDDRGAPAPRTACPGPWLTPVIRHDGRLMACCADLRGTLDLGSLARHSFRELWEGEQATRLRLAHLAGQFEGACATCGGINWYVLSDAHIAATRRRAAELGLGA